MEQPPQPENKSKLSRRDLFRIAITGAAIAATHTLTEGVSLNKPQLVLESTKPAGRRPESTEIFSGLIATLDSEGLMTIIDGGRLLFEPSGEFFTLGKTYEYVHRTNDIKSIREAYGMGANLFDIDANAVQGTVYGEHGFVPQVDYDLGRLGIKFHVPAVIDWNEMELKLGMPEYTYEDLVAFIGRLNTKKRPLAVSMEAKRGEFTEETLQSIFDTHKKCNVPVIVHSADPDELERIASKVAHLNQVIEIGRDGT